MIRGLKRNADRAYAKVLGTLTGLEKTRKAQGEEEPGQQSRASGSPTTRHPS
jgi:hypothetical protein